MEPVWGAPFLLTGARLPSKAGSAQEKRPLSSAPTPETGAATAPREARRMLAPPTGTGRAATPHTAAPGATTAHGALPAPAVHHGVPSRHWAVCGASASGRPPGQPSSGWLGAQWGPTLGCWGNWLGASAGGEDGMGMWSPQGTLGPAPTGSSEPWEEGQPAVLTAGSWANVFRAGGPVCHWGPGLQLWPALALCHRNFLQRRPHGPEPCYISEEQSWGSRS